MADNKTLGERWHNYRASKTTLFWSCVAFGILTIVVGFGWGGWVTGGTAQEMAQDGRRNLAATFCVQQFLAAADASSQHASLMEASTWQREDFIQKGGWAELPDLDQPISGVADLCADKLAELEVTASAAQASDSPSDTTVQ